MMCKQFEFKKGNNKQKILQVTRGKSELIALQK